MQLCYKFFANVIVDNAIYDYSPGDGLEKQTYQNTFSINACSYQHCLLIYVSIINVSTCI